MPRKIGKLKANKTFLIIVEGSVEKIYFSDVKVNGHISGVTITPKVSKHSDLYTILKSALIEYKSNVYDSIWCVFDRDTIIANEMSEETSKLYKKAISIGIHFADSMPAFEVWLLLHYAMPDLFYSSQDKVIAELKKHIPHYSKNQMWLSSANLYSTLKPYFDFAMENASELNKKKEEIGNENSTCSNVYKLFKELKEIVKNK
ncbi:RloB family protein [Treponema pectinovorum]|uniref:RloB family protein n=1 Tax=Treponema pectinovorum TaxID=164 RepID=UPI0011CB9A2C|nr:RloB family protein [Treponema pectinovorum]